jgi:hypothetical protein
MISPYGMTLAPVLQKILPHMLAILGDREGGSNLHGQPFVRLIDSVSGLRLCAQNNVRPRSCASSRLWSF